jgi:hypothetical protein
LILIKLPKAVDTNIAPEYAKVKVAEFFPA